MATADAPEAQILRRLNMTEAEVLSLGFGDPEFIAEPYAWLFVMLHEISESHLSVEPGPE